MRLLPKLIQSVIVPPIKCQGIKTQLVSFIANSIDWDGNGEWIEPFLGSGVVVFNLQPENAVLSDTNPHLIRFYQDIQRGAIDGHLVREYLEEKGSHLAEQGVVFYQRMRDEFNDTPSSLAFLFLNRACFNGLMRFNSSGGFNVPFNHKNERFSKAYVTKIVHQVQAVADIMLYRNWRFRVLDWHECLLNAHHNDFVYLDPPYIGRHVDYYNRWTESDAELLATTTQSLPCGYALSMWKENRFRKNEHLEKSWSHTEMRSFVHFYHVGAKEKLRHEMIEVLAVKPGYLAPWVNELPSRVANSKPELYPVYNRLLHKETL